MMTMGCKGGRRHGWPQGIQGNCPRWRERAGSKSPFMMEVLVGRLARFLPAVLLVGLILAGPSCGCGSSSAQGEIDLSGTPALPDRLAVYFPVPVNAKKQASGYGLPLDLSGVAGLDMRSLPAGVATGLRENGFALAEQDEYEHAWEIYSQVPGARFVSVDVLYQAFLGMCMGIRWDLERGAMRRDLESMLSSMSEKLRGMYESSRGSVREAAAKALGFVAVAGGLLGLEFGLPPEVCPRVEEEVRLVEEASEHRSSPLLGRVEDYRAYQPRGYYLGDPDLARFYRAVTWLGRWTLFSSPGEGGASPEMRREGARMTALLVGALHSGDTGGVPPLVMWDHIYQVTRFLSCGTVSLDALTAARVVREVVGERFPLSRLEDDSLVDRLVEGLDEEVRHHRGEGEDTWEAGLDAVDHGFRLLETGLEPGRGVFRELSSSGGVVERERPRGLDLPAALGSKRALQLLEAFYRETGLPGFGEKMRELRGRATYIDPEWARASLTWSMLNNALSLLRSPGEGYPGFMRVDAWKDRDLRLFLASWVDTCVRDRTWTPLEEDSGLEGVPGGGSSRGPEKGYVEPRPEAFALLAADADMLRRGLEERGLLGEETSRKLDSFRSLCLGLKAAAEKELLDQPLGLEEYQLIGGLGDMLQGLVSVTDEAGGGRMVPDPYAVLEIFRDTEEGKAVQLALGRPLLYYVVAPVEGRLTLTVGAGYSLYELAGTTDSAPTAEVWRMMVDSGTEPESPAWTSSFLR